MFKRRTVVFVPAALVLSGLMTVFLHSSRTSAASDHPGDPPSAQGYVCEPSPYYKHVWEKLGNTAQPIMKDQSVPFRLNPEVGFDVGRGALRFELKERSRMTIRLQPADKNPSYVLANAGVEILDSRGQSYDPEKLIRENESLFLELYLLLPPGSYLVEVIGGWNWGASTIPDSEKGRLYAAEVLDLIGAPLRTELLPLQTWFEDLIKGGAVLEVDWHGRTLWELRHPDHHHDARRLRNGNVILLCLRPLPPEIAGRVRGVYPGPKPTAPYTATTCSR